MFSHFISRKARLWLKSETDHFCKNMCWHCFWHWKHTTHSSLASRRTIIQKNQQTSDKSLHFLLSEGWEVYLHLFCSNKLSIWLSIALIIRLKNQCASEALWHQIIEGCKLAHLTTITVPHTRHLKLFFFEMSLFSHFSPFFSLPPFCIFFYLMSSTDLSWTDIDWFKTMTKLLIDLSKVMHFRRSTQMSIKSCCDVVVRIINDLIYLQKRFPSIAWHSHAQYHQGDENVIVAESKKV